MGQADGKTLLIQTKFRDSKVRIGSRKLYATTESIKKYALPVSKEDMPGSDEATITDLNNKRIFLGMHYYKAFELETLSKLLTIKKSLRPLKVKDRRYRRCSYWEIITTRRMIRV